jgi:aconitate hydratase
MGGGAYHIPMPQVTLVRLTGALQPWVSAKDIILEVLRRLTVKGGVGRVIKCTGAGHHHQYGRGTGCHIIFISQ